LRRRQSPARLARLSPGRSDVERALTLSAAGVDFHTRLQGDSPRAVFVHGFGGDLHTWDLLWEALGGALPALRYDLRGYGRSSGGEEEPFSHADDLLAILDALAIGQCDLVGVSMGGGIALHTALEHPDRVRSLTLISPALMGWEWSGAWRQRWRPIVELAQAGEMDAARWQWWSHPLFDSVRDSAASARVYEEIMAFAGAQWVKDNQRPVLPDVERLHRLATPTLLLTGGRDEADFRLIADLIEASAATVRRIDEPALGHLLHVEAPDICARRLLDFLGECVG